MCSSFRVIKPSKFGEWVGEWLLLNLLSGVHEIPPMDSWKS